MIFCRFVKDGRACPKTCKAGLDLARWRVRSTRDCQMCNAGMLGQRPISGMARTRRSRALRSAQRGIRARGADTSRLSINPSGLPRTNVFVDLDQELSPINAERV